MSNPQSDALGLLRWHRRPGVHDDLPGFAVMLKMRYQGPGTKRFGWKGLTSGNPQRKETEDGDSNFVRAGRGHPGREADAARRRDRPGREDVRGHPRLRPAAGHIGSRGPVHRIVQGDREPAAGAALGQGAETLRREGARDDLPGRAHRRAAQHLVRKVGHRLSRARRQRHARRGGDVQEEQRQARRCHRHRGG